VRQSLTEKRIDERLMFAYLGTLVIGLVMIYSTSSMLAEAKFGSHWHFLQRQFIWAILSVGTVVLISKLNLAKLAVYSVPAIGITLLMLIAVFLMPARNESHRWLFLGPFTVQPSEVFRLAAIVFLAFSLSNTRRDVTNIRQLLIPCGAVLGPGLLLILLEPDLGSTIVIACTILGILFLAGARIKHLLIATLPLLGGGVFVVFCIGLQEGAYNELSGIGS